MRKALLLVLGASCLLAQQRLTLKEAEQMALGKHPRIGAARFTAQAANQVTAEVRSNYMPQAFVGATGAGALDNSRIAAGGLNNPIIYDRLATGLTVSQFITDFGRTSNLVASSKLRAEAANQDTETARADVILNVDHAFYGLLRAQNVLAVARQTVEARKLVADQVTALAQSKLKSSLDVSFAKVNLSEAQLLLVAAENQVRSASAELSAALGYGTEQSFQLNDEPMPGALTEPVDTLVKRALSSRPELAGLRLEESAEQRFARAEHDLWYPTISTLATAGYLPAHEDALHNRYGAMGINVNIPIFNGGLFKARQSEAELRAASTDQKLKDTELGVARDVRVAYLNAITTYQRVGLTAQMADQARLALDLAQTRYDIGLGSIVELSQAQLNATSADIASISAKYDYQTARATLDYQVGVNR